LTEIIIPYRNRQEHLDVFLEAFNKVDRNDLSITIIEQNDDKEFNRGKLLNVGCVESNASKLILHDVDWVPKKRTLEQYGILNNDIVKYISPHNQSLGTVCQISKKTMVEINGHPNNIWGWGIEDRVLYYRTIYFGKEITQSNFTKNDYIELKHKTNAEQYIGNKKEINNNEVRLFLSNDRKKQIENSKKSGISNIEYKISDIEFLSNNIKKIKVEI
jgi:hypothetical protein